MPETPIAFDNVEVLAKSGLAYAVRIGGKEVFVGLAVPLRGTTVATVGDVGRLVLPRWFVDQEHIEGGHVQQ